MYTCMYNDYELKKERKKERENKKKTKQRCVGKRKMESQQSS